MLLSALGAWGQTQTPTVDNDAWYLVSPQLTNGQCLPRYRLTETRKSLIDTDGAQAQAGEGAGLFTIMLNDQYLTYDAGYMTAHNLTSNVIADNADIDWYVKKGDGSKYFAASNDDHYHLGFEVENNATANYSGYHGRDNYMRYHNVTGQMRDSQGYPFRFRKGEAAQYTIMIYPKYYKEGDQLIALNSSKTMPTTAPYYIIGNLATATKAAWQNLDYKAVANRLEMKPWWYKDGVAHASAVADADSTVYRVQFDKPADGWQEFRFVIADQVAMNESTSDELKYKCIRPMIPTDGGVDVRATIGGLIAGAGAINNDWKASFNLDVPENVNSFYFVINPATSTYRIIYNYEEPYIIGEAVSATGITAGWDLATNKIKLTHNSEEHCYKATLHLEKEKRFRFVNYGIGNTTFAHSWLENGYAPTEARPVVNGETQYMNRLTYHTTYSGDASDDSENVQFWLPTGDYVVRFYKDENNDNAYYTIERKLQLRDYTDITLTSGDGRTVDGLGDYKYFTTWSDGIAWQRPDGVEAYVVSSVQPATDAQGAVVTLTDITSLGYLPAATGLILVMKSADNDIVLAKKAEGNTTDFNIAVPTMQVFRDPQKTYTGTSLLTTEYKQAQIPTASEYTDDSGNKAVKHNYLFGYYRASKVQANAQANHFLLGFWLSNGNTQQYSNKAYLQLTDDQRGLYGIGNTYTMPTTAKARRIPAALLWLGDDTATAVTTPPSASAPSTTWHTLSGLTVTRPTCKGIYINNGKKIVIR